MPAAIAPSPVSSPSLSRMLHDCTAHCSLHFSGWIQNAEQALHSTPALPAAMPSRSKPRHQQTAHRSIASAREQRDAAAALQRLGGSSLRHKALCNTKQADGGGGTAVEWSNYRNLVLGLVCRDTPSWGPPPAFLLLFPVLLRCEVSLLLLCF